MNIVLILKALISFNLVSNIYSKDYDKFRLYFISIVISRNRNQICVHRIMFREYNNMICKTKVICNSVVSNLRIKVIMMLFHLFHLIKNVNDENYTILRADASSGPRRCFAIKCDRYLYCGHKQIMCMQTLCMQNLSDNGVPLAAK